MIYTDILYTILVVFYYILYAWNPDIIQCIYHVMINVITFVELIQVVEVYI